MGLVQLEVIDVAILAPNFRALPNRADALFNLSCLTSKVLFVRVMPAPNSTPKFLTFVLAGIRLFARRFAMRLRTAACDAIPTVFPSSSREFKDAVMPTPSANQQKHSPATASMSSTTLFSSPATAS